MAPRFNSTPIPPCPPKLAAISHRSPLLLTSALLVSAYASLTSAKWPESSFAVGAITWIGAGVAGGALGALVVAAFVQVLSSAFEGVGQELFNAAILSVAVVMLVWHNIW